MLESEHLTYSEELALLTKQRIEEAARKRHEWFGIQRMERELETEKFLKLKQLQREMESCEKARHLESKTLLMDSKRAQLYQIEEKEVMRQKEKKIKQMWLDVQRRFNEEMLEQDNLERKLLKVIAKSNQEMNSRNDECQKEINKINDKAARNEFAKEDASALLKDKLYMDRLKEMEKNKALSQHNVLTAQIKQNEENRKNTKQREINLELQVKKQNLWDILNNHYREEKQKIQDSVWQDHYIHHVRQENQRKHKESKEFDAMFLGTGCVLHPRNKIPYNKSTR
ncbi:uncharacterized protein LOC128867914 [Anastrepha ludens]|uniref:uncharacterized protein LOC128867914 n=1 Tax=Anastrepha ludens TaxID=28586 RepID=UPI0023B1DF1B|nr:uncharacterized protein LOC128867914 [Anastrepha ludens]